MADLLRLGMIGLDTSHVEAFTDLLHNPQNPWHLPGARVVAAFPGGSADFAMSQSRVAGFTAKLRDQYQVEIMDSPEAVAAASDAVLLEAVDGRAHLELFRRLASTGKPVFIDKPFAVSTADAGAMLTLAQQHRIPLMTCSALRYAAALTAVLAKTPQAEIIGADFYGPLNLEPTQPGFFWYGIHTAEMLFATLGKGCETVTVTTAADHDLAVGRWRDGRLGTLRGNRQGNHTFGGLVHRRESSWFVDVPSQPKPYYASLMEQLLRFFTTRQSPVDPAESLEIVRFLEAANESRATGRPVAL